MFSTKNQKIVTCIFLAMILLSTTLPWFGSIRDVQELKGFIILFDPLTVISVLLLITSIFVSKNTLAIILRILSFTGIIGIEIWYFLTWYTTSITEKLSLSTSFEWTYPEFYLSFIITCIPLIYNIIAIIKRKNVSDN